MSHYFDSTPEKTSQPRELSLRLQGTDLTFISDTAVFSRRQIDFGSRLLLETVAVILREENRGKGRLLDLGCGYGVLGLSLKRLFPALEVTLADVNQRALELTRQNSRKNHCSFVDIVLSDGWENLSGSFDNVVTNPPVRAGKQVVFSFYQGAYQQIVSGGSLFVVLQKKQGAPSSVKKLIELFGNCEIINKDAGYWILRSNKIEKDSKPTASEKGL